MSPRTTAPAAAVTATTGLAGTSTPPTPHASSPTPTATPTTARASTSTAATAKDIETELYEATVGFYSAITEAYKTLDPTPIRDVSSSECEACDMYVDSVESMKRQGHRFEELGRYIIEEFKVDKKAATTAAPWVTFMVTHTGAVMVDRNGKVLKRHGRQRMSGLIVFVRENGRLLVAYQDLV